MRFRLSLVYFELFCNCFMCVQGVICSTLFKFSWAKHFPSCNTKDSSESSLHSRFAPTLKSMFDWTKLLLVAMMSLSFVTTSKGRLSNLFFRFYSVMSRAESTCFTTYHSRHFLRVSWQRLICPHPCARAHPTWLHFKTLSTLRCHSTRSVPCWTFSCRPALLSRLCQKWVTRDAYATASWFVYLTLFIY